MSLGTQMQSASDNAPKRKKNVRVCSSLYPSAQILAHTNFQKNNPDAPTAKGLVEGIAGLPVREGTLPA